MTFLLSRYLTLYIFLTSPKVFASDPALISPLNATAFTASSTREHKEKEYAPQLAKYDSAGAWCPDQKSGAYLTIDLGQNYVITKIGTKGQYDEWTEKYELHYQDSNESWINYRDFDGNSNANDPQEHDIDIKKTQKLRFYPDPDDDGDYNKQPTLRVEAWGHPWIEPTTSTIYISTTPQMESTHVQPDPKSSDESNHFSTVILILVALITLCVPIVCFKMYEKRKMNMKVPEINNIIHDGSVNSIEINSYGRKRSLNKTLLKYGSNNATMKIIHESLTLTADKTNTKHQYIVEKIELNK